MFFYLWYRIGYFLCAFLPRRFCHWIARRLADGLSARAKQDWEAVRKNLTVILGTSDVPSSMIREVFRNFAMYLVDFFRFSRLTTEEVRRRVRIEGLEHMRQALREGKGAIGITAHLGNYELAAGVLSLMGMSVWGAVLTHRNARVDRFFTRQRERVGVKGIPVQKMGRKAFLEVALDALRANGILGLVADRDFFGHGVDLPLFGKTIKIPTGPAAFSFRTGAPIVPSFLIRESDGNYRFVMEPPIRCPKGVPREEAIRAATQAGLDVMARYIRQYPTQWYMFQEFWKPGPAVIL